MNSHNLGCLVHNSTARIIPIFISLSAAQNMRYFIQKIISIILKILMILMLILVMVLTIIWHLTRVAENSFATLTIMIILMVP